MESARESCRGRHATPVARDRFSALFGPNVTVVHAPPVLVDEQLFAEERRYLRRSVPKRRAEFGTARICARRALSAMNVAASALVPEKDRSPVWPEGVVGSISHNTTVCAVAVARRPPTLAVGIDVEDERPMDAGLLERICTPAERSWIASQTPAEKAFLPILFFSAKEAAYKCIYPGSRTFLQFHDVELELDVHEGAFRAALVRPVRHGDRSLTALHGRFFREHGLVACGTEIEA